VLIAVTFFCFAAELIESIHVVLRMEQQPVLFGAERSLLETIGGISTPKVVQSHLYALWPLWVSRHQVLFAIRVVKDSKHRRSLNTRMMPKLKATIIIPPPSNTTRCHGVDYNIQMSAQLCLTVQIDKCVRGQKENFVSALEL
jgi:hypothetical protein